MGEIELANDEPDRRDSLRSTRARTVRPRTENVGRISHRRLALLSLEEPPFDVERPRTRADCASVARPCPWVGCHHSLYLEVSARNGSIKLRFPDLGPEDMSPEHSCSLDVADRGGVAVQEVADALNMVRERVRQIQQSGCAKISRRHPELRELLEDQVEDEGRAVLEPEITAPALSVTPVPVFASPPERPPSGEVGTGEAEEQIRPMLPVDGDIRERVLTVLQSSGPLPLRAIALAADVGPHSLRAAVRSLRDEGLLELVGKSSASRWSLVGEARPAAILEATPAKLGLPSTALDEGKRDGGHPRAPATNGAAPAPPGAPMPARQTARLLAAFDRARRALEERRRALVAELQAIDREIEGAVPTNGSVAQRSPVVASGMAQPSA